MAVLERRRASKWHKQVTSTVREISPSEALSDGNVTLFPYAQVHAFTKEYLGKRKRSQIEKDKVLVDLINAHPRKEVAFASCADALSEFLVEELLNSIFHVDTVSLDGLEAYLQAFVAAAYSKERLFLPSDRTLAASVISVARDVVNQQITPVTAQRLFSAWRNGAPFDRFLLCRIKLLTRNVCQRVSADLAKRNGPAWWSHARDYEKAVSLLRTTNAELEDILHSTFPAWQSWANWTPDVSRLQVWASVASTNPFDSLRELEGPALKPGHHTDVAEWRTLIRRGELLPWLDSKGFKLGPGLITDDREEHLVDYVQRLLNTVISALKKGSAYSALLRLLIDKEGLDWQPLAVWEGAVSILHPEFINIISRFGTEQESDTALVRGLHALLVSEVQGIRTTLSSHIGKCVERAAERRRLRFLTCFASGQQWLRDAERLWVLRHAVLRSTWLHHSIDQRHVIAGRAQVSKASKLALPRLNELQNALQRSRLISRSNIEASVEVYVQNFVLFGAVTRDETTNMPQVLHTLFLCTEGEEIRSTGIMLASLIGFDLGGRTLCIRQLLGLSQGLVHDLHDCLLKLPSREHSDFVSLTRIVALVNRTSSATAGCWSNLLRWTMKEYAFHLRQLGFTSSGFKAYAEWIAHLHEIFVISLEGLSSTHTRLSALKIFEPAIEALEARSKPRFIISNLLIEADEFTLVYYKTILQCLLDHADSVRLELLSSIILVTEFEGWRAEALCRAVCGISELDDRGFSICQNLLDLWRRNQRLACLRLKIWLQMTHFDTATTQVLRDLAHILDLDVLEAIYLPATSVEEVKDYYSRRVAEMMEAAQRLEQARRMLKKVEPEGVDTMLTELGIERPTAAAQMIAEMPQDLMDVIDETAEDVVELHFPLSSPTMNTMERLAFGLKGSETLLVHLRVNKKDNVDGYCVHVEDGDTHKNRCEHNFTDMNLASSIPDRLDCHGRPTRLTYNVARQLWRQLNASEPSLRELYEGIQQFLHRGASQCMVCARNLDVSLHRPTLCTSDDCELTYRRSPLDVRLEDLRVDNRVADLLLSSVFAAASIKNLELLPNKPLPLGDAPKIVELLNSMPTTSALAGADVDQFHPDEQKESLFSWLCNSFPGFVPPTSSSAASSPRIDQPSRNNQTELLLSWLCNSYRGLVVSATDRYKIPNFPNVHQFLLVDAPPEIEAAFGRHKDFTPRHILFHGTSIDRLYSVLCQGLRVLSGPTLQKHGAAYGPGIYFAREPALAMNFSSRTAINVNAPFFNSRGDFKNATVLLGCEHAGNDDNATNHNGIHVVTDPSRVMVRYIWIVPHGTRVPRAQDLRIPMLSTFNDLRSTAVGKSG